MAITARRTKRIPLHFLLILAMFFALGASLTLDTHAAKAEGLDMAALNEQALQTLESEGLKVEKISTVGYSSAAVMSDGSLYMWGSNSEGQLGNGTTSQVLAPQKVNGISNVVSVELGISKSAAITVDGSLYVWGQNREGELGVDPALDTSIPQKVDDISNVIDVSISSYLEWGRLAHIAAVTADGALWTWGDRADIYPMEVMSQHFHQRQLG